MSRSALAIADSRVIVFHGDGKGRVETIFNFAIRRKSMKRFGISLLDRTFDLDGAWKQNPCGGRLGFAV